MRHILRKLFDIREGEGLRAFLMFTYIFLLIASLLIVKPVRNSLFLTTFGVEQLPYAFILVAIISGLFTYFYSDFSRKIRLNILMLNSTITSIAIFAIFWLLLFFNYQGKWFLYLFYVWVAIFGVVITMQFWLLANYVFNAREAKRLFGFVGAGAISGGIFGGYLTNYLAPVIGTESMLFICMGFLSICIFLLKIIWVKSARQNYREKIKQQKRIQQAQTEKNPIQLIAGSKHLAYLAGIVGIGVIVANLVDYQYSAVASRAISNEDELTAFFGFWLSNLSIISLVVQLFLTRKVLQTLGVAASLIFLPFGILIGAIAILINPVLWAAVLIKVSEGGLKQSINKSGIELLYLPVPVNMKNQAKAFIDVFVDSLATGIGGILLVVLIIGFGLTTGHVSIMIIALIAIWFLLIYKIRQEYINSFRLAIEKRSINIDEESVSFEDASVFESIIALLESKNDRQILYALNLLEDLKKDDFLPYFERLLEHPSREIKKKVLKILQNYDDHDVSAKIVQFIEDESPEVRMEAMQYLIGHSADKIAKLNEFLNYPDYQVSGSALISAAREIQKEEWLRNHINLKQLFEDKVKIYLSDQTDGKARFMKVNAAKIIGFSNDPALYPYLKILLKDSSLGVLQAAIVNAGKTQAKEFVPILADHLNTKIARQYAREALAEFGEDIIDELVGRMNSAHESTNIRLGIPKVLAMIGSQKSVNALIENLRKDDLALRYQTLKALNKLKVKFPVLKFDKKNIDKEIMVETRNYYQILMILYEQNNREDITPDTPPNSFNRKREARSLLIKALEEKLDDNLERIFRLLGLKYLQKDMYNAYLSIKSNKSDLRANAVEFLDNVLDFDLKKFIIPIVEKNSYDYLVEKSREFFGFQIPNETDCLKILLNGGDDWLKSCALYLIAELENNQCLASIRELKSYGNHVVRETAEYALNRLALAN